MGSFETKLFLAFGYKKIPVHADGVIQTISVHKKPKHITTKWIKMCVQRDMHIRLIGIWLCVAVDGRPPPRVALQGTSDWCRARPRLHPETAGVVAENRWMDGWMDGGWGHFLVYHGYTAVY